MNAQELHRILGTDRWVAFATVDDGSPRVRMMTVRLLEGEIWTYTSASSAKARQLRQNGGFEFVVNMVGEANAGSLRASGRARIVSDPAVKKRIAAASESFTDHFSSPDDPDFMLLRLDVNFVEIERGPDTKAERYALERGGTYTET